MALKIHSAPPAGDGQLQPAPVPLSGGTGPRAWADAWILVFPRTCVAAKSFERVWCVLVVLHLPGETLGTMKTLKDASCKLHVKSKHQSHITRKTRPKTSLN